ncbi:MAG TPA: fibronectin type III domain-containing protein [Thermoanaerobaculia bacterium]|nr:fibronectin type III domain-containing protein [Thermoanaerobaculia bacterium]
MARTFPLLLTALTLLFGSSVLSAAQRPRDRIPPTAPTNLVVTATTEHSASLAWGPSTDNSGRFSYIIRGGESTVTVGQETTSHTLEDLQSGKTYTFRVYAKDAAGNLSDPSNPVTVTLPGDLGAPTKPVVEMSAAGPTHAALSWSSTDDGPLIWYTIYIDGEPVSTLNSQSDTFTCAEVLVPTGCTPVDQETTYTFTVDARDVDGNFSPPSDPVFVTTDPAPNDHAPPEQPMNVATDFNGHIVVTWDPSTDDLAPQRFIRYDVYVNGELRAVVVGKTTAEVEGDIGVNEIAVIAVDTADNESVPGTATRDL